MEFQVYLKIFLVFRYFIINIAHKKCNSFTIRQKICNNLYTLHKICLTFILTARMLLLDQRKEVFFYLAFISQVSNI